MRRVLRAISLPVVLVGVGLVVADLFGVFGPGPSWVGFFGAVGALLGIFLAGPPEQGRMIDRRLLEWTRNPDKLSAQ
jgi:hypothetical protein